MVADGGGVATDWGRLVVTHSLADLDTVAGAWDRLAEQTSPFLTLPWLRGWCSAFASDGALVAPLLLDSAGGLLAGGLLLLTGRGGVRAPANGHSGDWGVVAVDRNASEAWWTAVAAATPVRRVSLTNMREAQPETQTARNALRCAGFSLLEEPRDRSPYLELPRSADQLLSTVSTNLRSQLKRRRRAIQRAGRLAFRTSVGGTSFERDLDSFIAVEASGWKQRLGTAIASDSRVEKLYRSFAREAADRGWVRLHLLELDDEVIAADLSCVMGGGEFLLKTGFDERRAQFSPGVLLRWAVLEQAVEAGLAFYDFLGGPDRYKMQWTDQVRPRTAIYAYRGTRTLLDRAYRSSVRPRLKRTVERIGLELPSTVRRLVP